MYIENFELRLRIKFKSRPLETKWKCKNTKSKYVH